MDAENVRPGGGRPRLPANRVRRHAIAIRTTKDLVDRLKRASETSGRSLAREIEHRLEQSFEVQDIQDIKETLIAKLRGLGKQLAAQAHDLKLVAQARELREPPSVFIIHPRDLHAPGSELLTERAGDEIAARGASNQRYACTRTAKLSQLEDLWGDEIAGRGAGDQAHTCTRTAKLPSWLEEQLRQAYELQQDRRLKSKREGEER